MTARVHKSGPDQALLTPHLSNGDRIRMGRVQPMVDEHGRPWSTVRLACEAFLMLAFGVAFYAMVAVLV